MFDTNWIATSLEISFSQACAVWHFSKVEHERNIAIHHRKSTSGCRFARKYFGAMEKCWGNNYSTACLLKGK